MPLHQPSKTDDRAAPTLVQSTVRIAATVLQKHSGRVSLELKQGSLIAFRKSAFAAVACAPTRTLKVEQALACAFQTVKFIFVDDLVY
jgi:hypothetical protein